MQVFLKIFTVLFIPGFHWVCMYLNREGTEEPSEKFENLLQRWQLCMNKNNCLLMVKPNKIKNNKMCGPWFFLQMKYDTWIGFELRKPNVNVDSFAPYKQ